MRFFFPYFIEFESNLKSRLFLESGLFRFFEIKTKQTATIIVSNENFTRRLTRSTLLWVKEKRLVYLISGSNMRTLFWNSCFSVHYYLRNFPRCRSVIRIPSLLSFRWFTLFNRNCLPFFLFIYFASADFHYESFIERES